MSIGIVDRRGIGPRGVQRLEGRRVPAHTSQPHRLTPRPWHQSVRHRYSNGSADAVDQHQTFVPIHEPEPSSATAMRPDPLFLNFRRSPARATHGPRGDAFPRSMTRGSLHRASDTELEPDRHIHGPGQLQYETRTRAGPSPQSSGPSFTLAPPQSSDSSVGSCGSEPLNRDHFHVSVSWVPPALRYRASQSEVRVAARRRSPGVRSHRSLDRGRT